MLKHSEHLSNRIPWKLQPTANYTSDTSWVFYSLWFKGIVHPKMKILSSFTHPQVVPNLYECLCSAEHKGRYSEECGKQSSSGAPLTSIVLFFPTMEVNGAPKQPGYKLSSKYLPSYRFGTTWGWVNDDRIFIFGWTIPLSNCILATPWKPPKTLLTTTRAPLQSDENILATTLPPKEHLSTA